MDRKRSVTLSRQQQQASSANKVAGKMSTRHFEMGSARQLQLRNGEKEGEHSINIPAHYGVSQMRV